VRGFDLSGQSLPVLAAQIAAANPTSVRVAQDVLIVVAPGFVTHDYIDLVVGAILIGDNIALLVCDLCCVHRFPFGLISTGFTGGHPLGCFDLSDCGECLVDGFVANLGEVEVGGSVAVEPLSGEFRFRGALACVSEVSEDLGLLVLGDVVAVDG
jgi:hypothetical protein